eukprot:gene6366-7628_t
MRMLRDSLAHVGLSPKGEKRSIQLLGQLCLELMGRCAEAERSTALQDAVRTDSHHKLIAASVDIIDRCGRCEGLHLLKDMESPVLSRRNLRGGDAQFASAPNHPRTLWVLSLANHAIAMHPLFLSSVRVFTPRLPVADVAVIKYGACRDAVGG